jgi:ATP-binding cassette, subfamily B, bacterial PglK
MKLTIKKLWALFNARQRRGVILLIFLIMGGTALEVLGVGAVIPLIVLLSQPDAIEENTILQQLQQWLQPESTQILLQWTLSGVIFIFLLKNIYLFGVVYYQSRFLYSQMIKISSRLYKSYLQSPYPFHQQHNSAELLRNIQMTEPLIQGVMYPIVVCFSEGLVGLFIFILLAWVNPAAAFFITFSLGILLGLFFLVVRKKLFRLGEANKNLQAMAIQHVMQGLASIKEIKILGRESFFLRAFTNKQEKFITSALSYERIAQCPRLFIESATIFAILSTLMIILAVSDNFQTTLVSFLLFLVAAVRMMPSANRLGGALSMLQFHLPKLHVIHDQLSKYENDSDFSESSADKPIPFVDHIELDDVFFQYETGDGPAVKNISLSIPKNSTIGFVGSSGAGKTTLIDLIIGIIKPKTGQIRVDGRDIHEKLSSWQQQIGYIPQSIYLADDTIKANIAFGIPAIEIDEDKIWSALTLVQLKDFVQSLPEALDTAIGEHGTLLSGGQRQRIGNARAIYHEPKVLVLDEATAALDNETERAFMDGIEKLRDKKTILLIAHRLSTVKNCDIVFFLKNGQLIDQGKFNELVQKNPEFCKMAQA